MQITPYSKNAKKHPRKHIDQVAKSIKEFGMNQPIVVDKEGVIIVGHGRYEALKQLGWSEKEIMKHVKVADLTEEQAKAYRLADNKLNESEWDMGLAIEELKGLSDEMFDLTGFDKDLLIEPDEKDDVIPENVEPVAKLGDIWQLGRHRVMCGDSTQPEAVLRLMEGKKADMVFTDPPYNVAYSSRGKNKALGQIENDEMSVDSFNTFLCSFAKAFDDSLKGDCPIYLCHRDTAENAVPFYQVYNNVGWKRSSSIIWEKNTAGMGWQHYRSQHEVISYGWKGKKPYFIDDRGRTTIWKLKRDATATYKHPTQKPVEVSEMAIINSSKQDDIVCDPFLGSGSTLIACEKTNRICYGMELDPKYVDVIIKRYEDYTGNKATKL